MPVYNEEIAKKFEKVADLLEIKGANEFRVRAYRDAARTIRRLSGRVKRMIQDGKELTELPGIGEDLAGKMKEIVETKKLKQLEDLKKEVPESLIALLDISGLGPVRVRDLYQKLDITSREDLKDAIEKEQIKDLEGFGEKIVENIKEALEEKPGEKRTKLVVAEEIVEPLVKYLGQDKSIKRLVVAGSYRRKKETVGDIDILATSDKGEKSIDYFVNYEEVEEIVSQGETKSTVILRTGMQVDLRVVEEKNYGAALMYFTGSREHNIKLRNIALDRGYKINEYGVFEDNERIAGKEEKEVYDLFNMSYIAPELRENRGEIEAAREGILPDLVEIEDIKGDLQMHTRDSDGEATIQEMVKKAQAKDYQYIAITDHSSHIGITQGLDEKGLNEQIEKIDRINEENKNITILKSAEVDILEDGSLDLPDSVLKKLDLVLCSIHVKYHLSREKQTERILRATNNDYFTIFSHPSSRIIGERDPCDFDMGRVMKAIKQKGVFLEINAQPSRLDLNDHYAKMAKEMGIKMSIATDAHSQEELGYMQYGLYQARRGWLEPEDIINTLKLRELEKLLGVKD